MLPEQGASLSPASATSEEGVRIIASHPCGAGATASGGATGCGTGSSTLSSASATASKRLSIAPSHRSQTFSLAELGVTLPFPSATAAAVEDLPLVAQQVTTSVTTAISATVKYTSRLAVISSGRIASEPDWFSRRMPYGDAYSLIFEPALLREVGSQTTRFIHEYLSSQAISSVLAHTVLATLLAAWTLPSYAISALSFIDSPWNVTIDRCDKAGKALANVLLSGVHGRRPVTLCGYGFGARVVFRAVLEIARVAMQVVEEERARALANEAQGLPPPAEGSYPWEYRPQQSNTAPATGTAGSRSGSASGSSSSSSSASQPGKEGSGAASSTPAVNPFSLLQDVILMGAPIAPTLDEWRIIRRIVAGRVVNCYCNNDYVLAYVYRGYQLAWNVAGIAPVCADPAAARGGTSARGTGSGGGSSSTPQSQSSQMDEPLTMPAEPEPEPEGDAPSTPSSSAPGSSGPAADAAGAAASVTGAAVASSSSFAAPSTTGIPATASPSSSYFWLFGTASTAAGQAKKPPTPPAPQAVTWWEGIESYDVSHIVTGHVDYRNKLQAVAEYIGLEGPGTGTD